jgi:signal transduction histidine kinase
MRFRHRLEGLEMQWNEAGSARIAPYSYLPPGDYTFQVTACNNDGVWSETGARVSFRLLPHFWQTWWFRAGSLGGASVLLAAGAVTFLRRRHRRKLDLIERQRAVDRERMRIAQDIHDDLGANLTRISLLSQSALGRLKGEAPAASDIQRIHQTAHDLTRALDEIVWAVNPRHDTLSSLVNYLTNYVEETLEPAGMRLSLDMPLSLPAWPLKVEVRHNLFLAAKEALNNVLKHAQATELRMSLKLADHGFTLELADNGCGFAVSTEGNGLGNMRHRMRDIGGDCQITSAPAQGTRIRFTVPVATVAPGRTPDLAALSPK